MYESGYTTGSDDSQSVANECAEIVLAFSLAPSQHLVPSTSSHQVTQSNSAHQQIHLNSDPANSNLTNRPYTNFSNEKLAAILMKIDQKVSFLVKEAEDKKHIDSNIMPPAAETLEQLSAFIDTPNLVRKLH